MDRCNSLAGEDCDGIFQFDRFLCGNYRYRFCLLRFFFGRRREFQHRLQVLYLLLHIRIDHIGHQRIAHYMRMQETSYLRETQFLFDGVFRMDIIEHLHQLRIQGV